MSVISSAVLSHSPSSGSIPLVGALRSGGRAFAQELSAAVPTLRRRPGTRIAEADGRRPSLRVIAGGRANLPRTRPLPAVERSAAAASEPTPSAPLQLTRRGRLLLIGLPTVLGVLAAAALLVVLLAPSQVSAGTEPAQGPGVESVTVQPGQSLWEVAQQAEPQRDTRDVVLQIVELNDLDSAQVSPGQQVLVPAA
jgi:hypothetical protein